MSARIMTLALGVALCAPHLAVAQQDTLHLTLDKALRLGHAYNPAYLRTENTAHAAGAAVRAGWGALLPRLNLSASVGGGSFTNVTGQDFYGRPVQLDTAATFRSSSTNQSLGLQFTLFDGFRTLNTAHQAAAQRDADVAAVNAQGAQLVSDIKTGFYNALMNERLIAVEERLLQSARDQLAATQRRFENAGADQVDVLGAQVAVAQQEQAVARQRGEAKKSLLALRQTVGLGDSVAIAVDGDFPDVFDPSSVDTVQLVTRALGDNPVLAQSVAAAAAAHAAASVAHGARWPTISGYLTYGRSMNLNSFGALTEFNPQNHGISFGVNLNFPLFSGFSTSSQIASANAASANADQTLRQQRLAVQTGVRSALIDLENAYQQSRLADRAAELAGKRLELSRLRYQNGSITFTELQQIVDQAAGTERNVVSARASFATALATLEQRVGGKVGP